MGVDPSRLAALLVLSIPRSMRSPRALPDRCLSTQTGKVIVARTLSGDETFLYFARSLSEISDRDEGVLVWVRCFDRWRRIVGLFNENGEG